MSRKYTRGHYFNLEEINLLVNLLTRTSDIKTAKKFFEIIFTKDELEKVTRRIQAILLFYQGKTCREVKKELKMGFNTVSHFYLFWKLNKKFLDNIFTTKGVEKREKIKEYTLLTPEMRYFLKRLLKGK
ncbi:MAG: Trp family transcriptional regulator [Patescibacteria group bacterium]